MAGSAARAPSRRRRDTTGAAGDSRRTRAAAAARAASPAQGRRRLVILVTLLLYLFGLVMVTSATSGTSLLASGDPWQYLKKEIVYGVLGFAGMLFCMRVPLSFVRRMATPLLAAGIGMLMLVFVPGLSHTANGATRWISIGSFQFQPSEVAKIAVVVYLADFLARSDLPRHWWKDFWWNRAGLCLAIAGISFLHHDLGTAMITGSIVLGLYLLCGTRLRLIAAWVGPVLALVALSIVTEPFRRARFTAFLNPWADPHGPGYQLVQALIAIGSGGPWGLGLGHSVEKLNFLPEAHTDMIFAIVAEELGLVGIAFIVLCFAAITVVGMRIAVRANDRFESLLAAGLTISLIGQAGLNLAGVVGVLPLTGVPLPLVSYGGTSLLVSLASLGLLANIAAASNEGVGSGRTAPAARTGGGRGHGGAPGAGTGRRRLSA